MRRRRVVEHEPHRSVYSTAKVRVPPRLERAPDAPWPRADPGRHAVEDVPADAVRTRHLHTRGFDRQLPSLPSPPEAGLTRSVPSRCADLAYSAWRMSSSVTRAWRWASCARWGAPGRRSWRRGDSGPRLRAVTSGFSTRTEGPRSRGAPDDRAWARGGLCRCPRQSRG